jgi:uncharacterized cofD-like protein
VWLTPDPPRALPQAVSALTGADVVVLGPGSLYTSVIPNILIPEIRGALISTRAWVVYVCNVMTQPGETDGYTAADHLDALQRHGLSGAIDVVLVNDEPVSGELVESYAREGARPVVVDAARLRDMGVKVAHAPVIAQSQVVRHDPERLARAVLHLVR